MKLPSESGIQLINALRDPDWRVRRKAVDTLLRQNDEGFLAEYIRKLRSEHRDAAVLNGILQVLVSMGSESLPALLDLVKDSDAEVRMYTALALGNLNDHRAIRPLCALLHDDDVNVRYHAIEALSKLKASEAVDDLAQIAESGDFFLAFAALDALAAIGESRIAARLIPLLEDDALQAAAVGALAELGDESFVPQLVALMERQNLVPTVVQALTRLQERYEKSYGEGQYVAELVREHTSAAAAQNLLSMLNNVSGDTLRALVRVLGWVGSDTIIAELTVLLGSSEVRNEVIETLVRHGCAVTDGLCGQFAVEDVGTRLAAVRALARIGDPKTVHELLRALDDPELVVEAAGALSKIGDPRAYEPLLKLLGHERAAVRQAAVAGINSLGHPRTPADIKTLLFHSNPNVRESAVRVAGYFGYPECAGQLLDHIHDVSENVRRAAVENLAHIQDDRVFDALVRAARDESPKIRAAAVQSLGFLENLNAFHQLILALKDRDAWVRYYAARALGRTGSPEAIDALASIVRNDEANQVRIAAADALGSIGGARVVSILAPLVDAADQDVARAALNALGSVGHPDALYPILSVLRAEDPARRFDAVAAMATRRDEKAVEALHSAAVTDRDEGVSEAALSQLAAMATPPSIAALIRLTADRHLRERAITALGKLSAAHLDCVAAGFVDSPVEVRHAVVEAVSRMKHPKASEFVSEALEDGAPAVRLAAVSALRRLGSHASERTLARMARTDPDINVRNAAEKALEGNRP